MDYTSTDEYKSHTSNTMRHSVPDEINEVSLPQLQPATSHSEYFSMSNNPRFSHYGHSSSESRRKSTPSRVQMRPASSPSPSSVFQPADPLLNAENDRPQVQVRGIIRDPANTKCMYLLVESSDLS